MDKNTTYNVKNRSAGIVIYTIPEASIRREFNVGETKKIPYSELEQLSYQVGGREIIAEYLIVEKEVIDELNMHVEPEYNYTE
jgi:hypothetical protein